MDYDAAAADRLEAVYRGADIARQRRAVRAALALAPGERVIDIGSGPGFLAEEMAREVGEDGAVCGVDLSPDMIARAEARRAAPQLRYALGDATALPEATGAFDVAVSTQVAEYVPDIAAFCTEMFRVLRPGGRGLVMATDWRALAWHSGDPDRMARVLAAFEPHCADPVLPRTLGARLRAAGFDVAAVTAHPIVNTDWSEENYSCTASGLVASYIAGAGTLSAEEVAAWRDDLRGQAARGAYFFMSNRVMFHVRRPD